MSSNNSWKIERRHDGVILVRVPSENRNGQTLPDAVFSFRAGDPQYKVWEERWEDQQKGIAGPEFATT